MPFKHLEIFSLSATQITQFEKLLKLYQDWNSKINLSAIRKKDEIILKHFYDSLLITQLKLIQNQKLQIADLGTGGGYPLLPLAIVFPEINFLGVDSVQKKISVIEDIAQKLNLNNIHTSTQRVEMIGQNKDFREKFDFVTTRAFAKWHTLLELALPLVKVNGKLIAYQGPQILGELEKSEKVINLLGGKIESLSHFELPENMGERVFVVIQKKQTTPLKYPREVGMPKKTPLK